MKHTFLRRLLALGLSALLAVPAIASPAFAVGEGDEPLSARPAFTIPAEGAYAPDQLLVVQKTDPAARHSRAGTSFASEAVVGTQTVYDLDLKGNDVPGDVSLFDQEKSERYLCTLVDLAPGSDLDAVAQELYADPTVTAVAPNRILHMEQTPITPVETDAYEEDQTWLEAVHAYDAWETLAEMGKEPGAGVTVVVADTGVDVDHPDLKGRLISGKDLYRYYYMDENKKIQYNNNVTDMDDHGTHVSGAILGERNGTGIVGGAYGAKLLPLRVLGDDGLGYEAAIIQGVQYIVDLKNAAVHDTGWGKNGLPDRPSDEAMEDLKNLKVLNMSLGGMADNAQEAAVYDPVYQAAREAGILPVVAAGNDDLPTTSEEGYEAYYSPWSVPACSPWAFAVMATNERADPEGDQLVYFSNWDSDPGEGVEYQLMAPGTDILSTIPRGYGLMSGTSMATPVTAGVAALLMSAYPDAGTSDIWNALINVDKAQGRTDFGGNSWSYPSLDAAASLENLKEERVPEATFGLSLSVDWGEDYRYLQQGFEDGALLIQDGALVSTVKLVLTCYAGKMTDITVGGATLGADGAMDCEAGTQIRIPLTADTPLSHGDLADTLNITYTDASDGASSSETTYPLDLDVIALVSGFLDGPLKDRDFSHMIGVSPEYWPILGTSGSPVFKNGVFYKVGFIVASDEPKLTLENCLLIGGVLEKGVNLKNCTIVDSTTEPGHGIAGSVDGCTFLGGGPYELRGNVTNSTFSNVDNIDVTGDFTGNLVSDCFDATLSVTGDVTHNTFLGAYTQDTKEGTRPLTVQVETGEEMPAFRENAVVGPLQVTVEGEPAEVGDNFYLHQGIDPKHPVPYLPESVADKLDCANWDEAVDAGTIATLRSYKGMEYPEELPGYLDDCPPFLLNLSCEADLDFYNSRFDFLPYDCTALFSTAMDTSQATAKADAIPYTSPTIYSADLTWSKDGRSSTFQRGLTVDLITSHIAHTIYGLKAADGGSTVSSVPQYLPSLECWLNFRTDPGVQVEKAPEGGLKVTWDKPELDPWLTGEYIRPDKKPVEYEYMTLRRTDSTTDETSVLEIGPFSKFDVEDGRCTFTDNEADQVGTVYIYEVYVTEKRVPAEGDFMMVYGAADYLDPGEPKASFASETASLRVGGTAQLTLDLDSGAVLKEGERLDVTFTYDPAVVSVADVAVSDHSTWTSGVSQTGEGAVLLSVGPDYNGTILPPGSTLCTVTLKGVSVSDGALSAAVQAVELDDQNHVRDLGSAECAVSVSAASSGGGGGGSSSSTQTEKNEDGSTTKTVTNKSTGTVTETTTWPDGRKEIVETKKDGTVTTTETRKDGYKSVVILSPDGTTSVEILVPKDDVKVVSSSDGKGTTTASVTAKGTATVTIPVENVGPGTVAVLVGEDGSRRILPNSAAGEGGMTLTVDGNCKLEIVDNSKAFSDVAKGTWYADAVTFVTARELFQGTGEGTFSPELPMSRAMLFTVLARMDGQDTAGGDTWYAKAMAWAVSASVSDGTDPGGDITREQLAVMLYRYADSPASDGTLEAFTDADEVSGYAADALGWAAAQGIVTGKDGGVLDPKGEATRAQVSAMIMRYLMN